MKRTNHNNITQSDKSKFESHDTNDQVNEIIGQTCAPKNTKSECEDIKDPHASESPDSSSDSE